MSSLTKGSSSNSDGLRLRQIVSGGQTGVDRSALDAAIFLGIEHGGWCPQGRRAEDGTIDSLYQLKETAERDYAVRTERNVVESDGTLIICKGPLTGGTRLTKHLAKSKRRPCLVLDFLLPAERYGEQLMSWLVSHQIAVLNIAGPRESSCPGISELTERFLVDVFATDYRQ